MRLLPPHQGKLLAVSTVRWLLNAFSCMFWSEAFKAVAVWVCAGNTAGTGSVILEVQAAEIPPNGDSHIQWASHQMLKRNKMQGSRSCHLIYTGVPTYSGELVPAASSVQLYFSGQVSDHNWRRLVLIKSSRGQSLFEIKQSA